ncbi:DUF2442 domain-containing protein [Gammaproteobacteria bacterium]
MDFGQQSGSHGYLDRTRNKEMKQPNIHGVIVIGDKSVSITWASGEIDHVDFSMLINNLAGLSALDDDIMFSTVAIGEHGWSLIWENGVEIGSDTAWRIAREQAGDATTITEFSGWRERNRLSLSEAAKVLGITRRMISYYESGRYLIPKLVGLACKGWEAEQSHLGR